MQDSKLPLTVWFEAMHLISTSYSSLSVQQFQNILGIKYYKTAWTLIRKFWPLIHTKILEDIEPLEDGGPLDGIVDVIWTEIPRRPGGLSPVDGRFLIAGAFEVIDQTKSIHTNQKPRFRLATITDDGAGTVKDFVRANIKSGAILLTDSHKSYHGLTDYRLYPRGRTSRASLLRSIAYKLSNANVFDRGAVDIVLKRIVAQENQPSDRVLSFESLLKAALRHEPTSYWDMIDRENPRKGKPTIRRHPRRRKTANGMRQDRAPPTQGSDVTPG